MITQPQYQVRVHTENGVWVADLIEGDPSDDALLFGAIGEQPDLPDLVEATAALIHQETGLAPGQYRLTVLYAIPVQMQVGDAPLRTVGWIRKATDEADMQALADLMRCLAREFTAISADPRYVAPDTLQTGQATPWYSP